MATQTATEAEPETVSVTEIHREIQALKSAYCAMASMSPKGRRAALDWLIARLAADDRQQESTDAS